MKSESETPLNRSQTLNHAKPKRSVKVRTMEILWILKGWRWPEECLCQQGLAVVTATRGNTTVLSKNWNKGEGTNNCGWISARAGVFSPFVNEQVFVSRQRTQIDSVRLLDKRRLHLLQRARQKRVKRRARFGVKRQESLLLFHCCRRPGRSSSSAAPLQPIRQLERPEEENLRDCCSHWIISDEVLSWSGTVSSWGPCTWGPKFTQTQ